MEVFNAPPLESCSSTSFFLPYPLLGLSLRSLEGDRGGIDNPAMHYVRAHCGLVVSCPSPKNHDGDDYNGGWDDCPTPPRLCIHYMCISAARQRSSASKADRTKTNRKTQRTQTGKNKNLEDKGGRGDRLSPVGILNPCGFNTPPQPVHSDRTIYQSIMWI